MEVFKFFLKKQKNEKLYSELLIFFEGLSLYLEAGYDLSTSWSELRSMNWSTEFYPLIQMSGEVGVVEQLKYLAEKNIFPDATPWFLTMQEQYLEGASMLKISLAMNLSLRRDRELRLKQFMSQLPTRINILLIIFFLPGLFLMLLWPLVTEITRFF